MGGAIHAGRRRWHLFLPAREPAFRPELQRRVDSRCVLRGRARERDPVERLRRLAEKAEKLAIQRRARRRILLKHLGDGFEIGRASGGHGWRRSTMKQGPSLQVPEDELVFDDEAGGVVLSLAYGATDSA